MFTGIVEEVGEVLSFEGMKLTIHAPLVASDVAVSDSVCVAGACLTVIATVEGEFSVEVVPETISRTSLGDLQAGDGVNLERSLAHGGRIGGHIVQGHVDGTATVTAIEREGDGLVIRFAADETIMRYVVPKGFVAVDGISLTVVDRDDESFSVAIIPYTLENTTLKDRAAGSRVNVEVDITAKYVEQMAKPYLEKLLEEARDAAGP